MKRVLFLVIFCILITGQVAYGQEQPAKPAEKGAGPAKLSAGDYPNLKTQADEINAAGTSADYGKVADFTHPKVVAGMGGREKMVAFMKKEFDQMKSEGFEVISNETDKIAQIEQVGDELFALVRIKMTFKTPQGKMAMFSHLVGISNDKGVNWKFVSVSDQEKFKSVFPDAGAKIKIPPQEAPTLIEN